MERKHYYTQLLFHHQSKPLRPGTDNRHLEDENNPAFVYYVKGDDTPHLECKGLHHDEEVRYEKGHIHDVWGNVLYAVNCS